LDNQFTDTLQVVIDFVQRAFRRLGDGNPIVGIAGGLCQALDVGGEAVGDGLASGVVLGAVDAQARGQALDRGTQGALRLVQVVLGDQSEVVSVDSRRSLFIIVGQHDVILPQTALTGDSAEGYIRRAGCFPPSVFPTLAG